MIRAIDPLFTGLTLRLRPFADESPWPARPRQDTEMNQTRQRPQKPRWDAPSHWFEQSRDN